MSHFCELGGQANLAPHVARGGGLREAQFGALAGLVAHSTVSGEPAQIVLPTGVGKTAVATLVPYVLQAGRALVVVPGKLIRSQIVAAFQDPSSAIAAGVLPVSTTPPTVAVADHWATDADWERWQSADVVIGTPAVLSPAYARVAALPRGLFDLVIFDEAHHLPASTWTSLLPGSEGRAVLLTATPFRNDGKRLPGEMIYTYPLSRAIDQGVYGEVRYIPVDAVDGEELDLTLAQAAADRIHQREHAEAKSRRNCPLGLCRARQAPRGNIPKCRASPRADRPHHILEAGTANAVGCGARRLAGLRLRRRVDRGLRLPRTQDRRLPRAAQNARTDAPVHRTTLSRRRSAG